MVNSREFGARNDGATPISNRRALNDNVPNFSSIDYNNLWAVYTSISETTQVGRGNPHLLIICEFPLTKIDGGNIMPT
ncbi:MAG TPA: palindromic element RPE2 domain-containing protein [Rickettsia endosymbiont of Sericostoma sp.]|nr:palindromic element RPE2 domain-containing protein [Rickettsia endosymbiont of Sericostoma sp. HW-2014]HJD63835.1 palindromic element RPE2 domain-containing protein [Rickettsia endosymbiont of Sericostoma sp.]